MAQMLITDLLAAIPSSPASKRVALLSFYTDSGRITRMSVRRSLRDDEKALLAALIDGKPQADMLLSTLDTVVVEELNEGGMGSLRFCRSDEKDPQRLGDLLAEKEFIDSDGVAVMVAVNLDQSGQLFELDIWKVDFSPLKRFPVMERRWPRLRNHSVDSPQ